MNELFENSESMKQEKIFTHQTVEEYYRDNRVVYTPPPRKPPAQKLFASIHDPNPARSRPIVAQQPGSSPLTSGYEQPGTSTVNEQETIKHDPIYQSNAGI